MCGVCFVDATGEEDEAPPSSVGSVGSPSVAVRTSEWKKKKYTQTNFLPSTPEEIAAYKEMMKAKYEAQQREAQALAESRRLSPGERLQKEKERLTNFISNPPAVPTPPFSPASPTNLRRNLNSSQQLQQEQQKPKPPLPPKEKRSQRAQKVQPPPQQQQQQRKLEDEAGESPVEEAAPFEGEEHAHVVEEEVGAFVDDEYQRDERVERILVELQLEKYIPVICDAEEITYDALLLLTTEDLQQMGLPTGPRKILLSLIGELNRQK